MSDDEAPDLMPKDAAPVRKPPANAKTVAEVNREYNTALGQGLCLEANRNQAQFIIRAGIDEWTDPVWLYPTQIGEPIHIDDIQEAQAEQIDQDFDLIRLEKLQTLSFDEDTDYLIANFQGVASEASVSWLKKQLKRLNPKLLERTLIIDEGIDVSVLQFKKKKGGGQGDL